MNTVENEYRNRIIDCVYVGQKDKDTIEYYTFKKRYQVGRFFPASNMFRLDLLEEREPDSGKK